MHWHLYMSVYSVHTVANAWAAGLSHVDIYLFPAYGCATPEQQVSATISSMGSIPFGTLWFDIEASGSGWSGNPADNNAWLNSAVNQAVAEIGSSRVGIYSSAYGWSVVMGSYSDFSWMPIWYAHYDGTKFYLSTVACESPVQCRCIN